VSNEATAEWADEFPATDGDYYSRIDEYDKSPTPIRIEAGKVFEFGCEKDLNAEYQAENYQYLGPITPDLFAEVGRLREALEFAVKNYTSLDRAGLAKLGREPRSRRPQRKERR